MTAPRWTKRLYRPDDEGFILFSWLKSFAASDHGRRHGASSRQEFGCNDYYWDRQRTIIISLMKEPTTRVDVLCDPDRDDVIWAWLATGGPRDVYYALAKFPFWKDGLGVDMLTDLLGTRLHVEQMMSHEQCGLREVGLRVPAQWKYDPYSIAWRFAA